VEWLHRMIREADIRQFAMTLLRLRNVRNKMLKRIGYNNLAEVV
jgi:hypothetical protein